MNGFRSYLAELFEQPFSLKSVNTGRSFVTYFYEIDPKQNSENNLDNTITVNFSHINPDEDEWDMDFDRGGTTALTGKGEAGRVFATVLDAVKQFIQKYKPNTVLFTAAKNELRATDLSYRSGSRIKLYHSLIKRFAPRMGYKLVNAKDVGSVKHLFVLQRVKP